jgi:hypothetical protein
MSETFFLDDPVKIRATESLYNFLRCMVVLYSHHTVN